MLRENAPAQLPHRVILPKPIPITNGSGVYPIHGHDKHASLSVFTQPAVTFVSFGNCGGTLWAPEMTHHCRVAQKPLKKRQVALCPRSEFYDLFSIDQAALQRSAAMARVAAPFTKPSSRLLFVWFGITIS
jgi:hypothetical protein